MDNIKELTNILLGGMVVICLAWVFAPRTWHFSDTQIIYPVTTSFCNQYNVCDIETFLIPFKIRVDIPKSEVVWMTNDRGMGAWDDCVILDKHNWRCGTQFVSMVNGQLESRHPAVYAISGWNFEGERYLFSFISGWSYRTYWLLSFLPTVK
jgi:hypothetical protein